MLVTLKDKIIAIFKSGALQYFTLLDIGYQLKKMHNSCANRALLTLRLKELEKENIVIRTPYGWRMK